MYLKSTNSSGNYVFFDAIDINSMKSIDRGYNCYMVEYKREEIKDTAGIRSFYRFENNKFIKVALFYILCGRVLVF